MKNSNYLPFERNRYFYGKLLSVDDFELEQKYGNDKRRAMNRFLHGAGVVAGLQVVEADDSSISIERGISLDYMGREIVVDLPVIRKLSFLDGFSECIKDENYFQTVYLYIEYAELEEEPVHNAAGSSVSSETGITQYNKIKETFRLFLTGLTPAVDLSPDSLFEKSQILYQDAELCIRQILPRVVKAGEYAQLRIEIENKGKQYAAFSYDCVLTCFTCEQKPRIKITFDEQLLEKSGFYKLCFKMKAHEDSACEGTVVIEESSVRFSVGNQAADPHITGRWTVDIVTGDVKTELISQYYKNSMETIIKDGFMQGICLARLELTRAGDSFLIDKIENVPFKQYVMNQSLQAAVTDLMRKEILKLQEEVFAETGAVSDRQQQKGQKANIRTAQGVWKLELGIGGQKGQRYQSKEFYHELGTGLISVIVGVENKSGQVLFGNTSIFQIQETDIETAVKVFPEKGSFLIGARLLSVTTQREIQIHWTVFKNKEEDVRQESEKKIFIKPSVINLKPRESFYLEAVCSNLEDHSVIWKVAAPEDGIVDQEGMYTAPNSPGVYEIIGESRQDQSIRASAFAVVRKV